jgi:polysaccharide pyruvyl transferase WcaK-like protein
MRVCIYTAISERNQYSPVLRSLEGSVRNRLRRVYDALMWSHLDKFTLDYWVYEERWNSNVGDIAIRLAIIELLRATFGTNTEFFSLQWRELSDDTVREINDTCSLFIVGGSGYFHLDDQGNTPSRLTADLVYLRRIAKPIIGFGLGVNITGESYNAIRANWPSAKACQAIKEFTSLCRIVAVRDTFSKEVLARSSFNDAAIVVDPAFLLASDSAESLPTHSDICGVNFGLHGPTSTTILRNNISTYLAALKAIQLRHGYRFLYFVHSDAELIIPSLLKKKGVSCNVARGDPHAMLAQYRTLDVHICQMLHSAILAMSVEVPVLNLAYDVKNVSFFQLLEVETYQLSAIGASTNDIIDKFDQLVADKLEIRRSLAEQRIRFLKHTNEVLERVRALCATQS